MVIGDLRERGVCDDANERAFELADVRRNDLGDERRYLVGHGNFFAFGLFAQNRFARFQVGSLNVGEQSPFEPGAQPRLEGLDFFGRPVGRNDQLAARLVQRVERVKELFLRRLFAGEELDVVDQQDVDLPVPVAEFRRPVILQCDDELVGEFLARDVHDVGAGIVEHDAMADRVHEVGLAQTDAAVEEKRVIGACGGAGHGLRRRRGRNGWSCRRRTLRRCNVR